MIKTCIITSEKAPWYRMVWIDANGDQQRKDVPNLSVLLSMVDTLFRPDTVLIDKKQ